MHPWKKRTFVKCLQIETRWFLQFKNYHCLWTSLWNEDNANYFYRRTWHKTDDAVLMVYWGWLVHWLQFSISNPTHSQNEVTSVESEMQCKTEYL